jgi:hypothetical protein
MEEIISFLAWVVTDGKDYYFQCKIVTARGRMIYFSKPFKHLKDILDEKNCIVFVQNSYFNIKLSEIDFNKLKLNIIYSMQIARENWRKQNAK